MRISFDLDDTLICYQPGTPCEPRPRRVRWLLTSREPLRSGSRELMLALERRGWEVWIYTTSYRTPWSVRRWLKSYGIRVGRVINQKGHERRIRQATPPRPPSKHPGLFDIDLHVDDLEGVRIEGEWHGFRVLVVAPDDVEWAEKVLSAAEAIRAGSDFAS
ncbi:hypothetical protein [Singulisphaera sp. PoT]|uniref:hypothetical protein n=1 Tax=Singulisphaera sp. PoT TaxID=3411797 RepID=UPI003BF57B80